MFIFLGSACALAGAVLLARKWKLGTARAAAAVSAIGAMAGTALFLLTRVVPITPVAQSFLAAGATLALSFLLLAFRFYRDPTRIAPDSRDLVVSPADGEVVYVHRTERGELPVSSKGGRRYALRELTRTDLAMQEAVVVGISMSFLDVHVNRSPIAGTVTFHRHLPGRFGSLRKGEARFENERATTVFEAASEARFEAAPGARLQVAVVQIASRLVRQIVVWLEEGQHAALGQRMGMIRFGSQVDVVLPARADVRVSVSVGDRVRAGESVIAVIERETVSTPFHQGSSAPAKAQPAPGAIIISGDSRGLSIARSLGRHGVPVRVAKAPGEIMASSSRYVIGSFPWSGKSDSERLRALLDQAANGCRGWTVFPTTDEAAVFISRNHRLLSEQFVLSTPPWETLRWAYDKRLTYSLAQSTGLPVPRTWNPVDRRALDALDLTFPVILKPAVKDRDNAFTRARAWRVDNRGQLAAGYEAACRLVPAELILVQEFLPGGGSLQYSYTALCRQGAIQADLTARRTRQYPPDFGHSSSFVETVDEPAVESAGARMLAAMEFSGLVEVEMKLDPRLGVFKVLDVNPRAWTWIALGARAGVDFPYAALLQANGHPVPRMRGRAGVAWVRMGTDVISAAVELARGRLTPARYVRGFRAPLQPALFAMDDILPLLLSFPGVFASRAARLRSSGGTRTPTGFGGLRPARSGRAARPVNGGAPGALVIGGDYQGLGIARSLGRRGVPVIVIDDEPSIARFSRYTSRSYRVADLRDPGRTVETVMDLGRSMGLDGWVLYPTRDETVAAFSTHRDELRQIYRVPTPGWESVRIAWDKRLTYRLAGELGIPAPRTWCVQDAGDLAALPLEFPVVLKPAIKEHFIYASKVKALRADNREQLEDLFARSSSVIPAGEVMLQELLPGGGEKQFAYCAFFREGRPAGKMVVRRTRQRPADFGRSSTCVESISLRELEEPSERFLAAMGYYGLAELEYKLDERDGRYKLLDVNPRTWGYHSIGARAGVDFPWLLYRDQVGTPEPAAEAQTGIRWMRLSTDLPAALEEILRGRLRPGAFLRSLGKCDTEAVFAGDDLLPAFAELAHLPYLYMTRGWKRWKPAPR